MTMAPVDDETMTTASLFRRNPRTAAGDVIGL